MSKPAAGRPPARERSGWARLSRIEVFVAAGVAIILLVLAALEPDILEAPFASGRAMLFTFGGTAAAAVALVAMLRWHVHPVGRLLVLGVPFVAVQWWLISPFFVDDVVDEEFETSIAEQQAVVERADPPPEAPASTAGPEPTGAGEPAPTTAPPPAGPVLLGAGQFVGLAGHEGRGDAGVFRLDDGRQVLRFENFDIDNGPDLEVYVVPGRDQTALAEGSIHLGALRGNVGDQTYELPGTGLGPGDWTVLVWCEAFTVEFVGATLTIA